MKHPMPKKGGGVTSKSVPPSALFTPSKKRGNESDVNPPGKTRFKKLEKQRI